MNGLEIAILTSTIGVLSGFLGVFFGFLLEMKRDNIAKARQEKQQRDHLYQEFAFNKLKSISIRRAISDISGCLGVSSIQYETRAYDMLYDTGKITAISNDFDWLISLQLLYVALKQANVALLEIDNLAHAIDKSDKTMSGPLQKTLRLKAGKLYEFIDETIAPLATDCEVPEKSD